MLDDRKSKEIKLIENNLSLELNEEKYIRKDMEQRVTKKLDEKMFSLRMEVAKEQKNTDELLENNTKSIIEQLENIQLESENERRLRYAMLHINELINDLVSEMKILSSFLIQELYYIAAANKKFDY